MADDISEAAREEKARRQRAQDRNDLWTEQAGVNNGRLRRFITDPADPRTAEGREKKRADRAMMRSAEAAARWASETVNIGGMEMSRADAQAARRRILENPEHYARLARERGYIRPGEEDALIGRIRRMEQLEAKRERGETLSASEEAESKQLEQAETGPEGNIIREAAKDLGIKAGLTAHQANSSVLDRGDGSQRHALRSAVAASGATDLPTMKDLLPSAPDVGVAFAAGTAATAPLDVKPLLPASATPQTASTDPTLKATGLDL